MPESVFVLNFFDDRISVVTGKSSFTANAEGEIELKSTKDGEGEEWCTMNIDNTKVWHHAKLGDRSSATVGLTNSGLVDMMVNSEGKNAEINIRTTEEKTKVVLNDSGGILIETDSSISIKSTGINNNISIKADGDLSIEGQNVSIKSKMASKLESETTMDFQSKAPMTIKSEAISNIESTGPMTIKGAIVNINP